MVNFNENKYLSQKNAEKVKEMVSEICVFNKMSLSGFVETLQ